MTRPVINVRGLGTVAEGGAEIAKQSSDSDFPDPLKTALIVLGVLTIVLGVVATIAKKRGNASQLSDAENATKTDSEDPLPGNTADESKPQSKTT
ncbi:hypothetical protein K435DRAFT_876469 [Dendrothele bispora CBS 962.96]|uniref:Uncharacterized protein n=1 Tax=Dendrothele bispora (strain CBS 962.96) TaxID=1314807 RepID=A0A4S8KSA9_DENBC|nr:hypothetical protein K435DRAFT_876469 [Dendrothele bispora CBS 962.96]